MYQWMIPQIEVESVNFDLSIAYHSNANT